MTMIECINTTASDNGNGYGRQWFDGRKEYAHRLAWIQANGPIPEGLMVLHSCDNRQCVNIEHLRLGAHADNMNDMTSRRRNRVPHPQMQGSKHHQAKLSESDVRNIRDHHRLHGFTQKDIAERYGITPGTVGFITKDKTWRNVR